MVAGSRGDNGMMGGGDLCERNAPSLDLDCAFTCVADEIGSSPGGSGGGVFFFIKWY